MGILDNFSFNIPGTREARDQGGHHNVVVYTENFGVGVVVEYSGRVTVNCGRRRGNGYPATESVTIDVFDPIVVRCIAMNWLNTHGGNDNV